MFVRYTLLVLIIGIAGVYLLPRYSGFHREGRVILNPYVEGSGATAKPPIWLPMAGAALMIAGAALLDRLRHRHTPPEPFVYYKLAASNTEPTEESDFADARAGSTAASNTSDSTPLQD